MWGNKANYFLGLLIICITLLFCLWLRYDYLIQKNKFLSIAAHSFEQVVKAELKEKMKGIPQVFQYDSHFSKDSILWEEKNNWALQFYLTSEDTQRQHLDSLFHMTFTQQDIQAQTAIRCKINMQTTYSSPDTSFFKKAIPLPMVIYRKNNTPEGRCELQAYVQFSFFSLLMQVPSFGSILLLEILSILFLIGGWWYRKKYVLASGKLVLHTPVSHEWEQLPNGLLLNEKSGKLKHEENIIELVENRLKLFIAFLRAPEYFLAHEEICEKVLERKIIDTLTISDREAAITTVKRLRKDLASISFIEIKSSRGKGYQLVFHESVNRL